MRDPIRLFEQLCIFLAGEGFHLPAYYLSTLFCFPVAEYLWHKRKILKLIAVPLVFLGIYLFVLISWRFFVVLILVGRILHLFYTAMVRYEIEREITPRGLPFYLGFLYQKLCERIFGNWYKPVFFLSTGYILPGALWLWTRKRIIAKGIALLLLVLYGALFFSGWWILIVIFFVAGVVVGIFVKFVAFLYKNFRIEEKETVVVEKETLGRLDVVSLGFIAFIFISFVVNWQKFAPNCVDTWYHLAVGRKILEFGTIPVWDSWEFAPAGRPHLYPPLIHLLIAAVSGSTENIVTGGKILQALFYPLSLLTNWIFFRYFFDKKIAFLALIFLSMDIGFLLINTMILPSMLVNILLPLLLICFFKKNLLLSVILMALCLYSHLSFPFVILFFLFLIARKYEYMGFYKKFALFSLILYLPWFLRILQYHGALETTMETFSSPVHLIFGFLSLQFFNVILIPLGVIGYRRAGDQYTIIKMILLGSLPILVFYGGRYWFHTIPFWAIMIAVFAGKYLVSKKRVALFLILAFVPTLDIVLFESPGLLPSLTGGDAAVIMWDGEGITFENLYGEDCEELAAYIRAVTPETAIIGADEPWVGDMIVTLTGRRVTTGAWWEVSSMEEKEEDIKIYVSLKPVGDFTIGRFSIEKVS
jgi:hypothetical protein